MANPKLAYETKGGVRKYRNPRDNEAIYDSVTWAVENGVIQHGLNRARLNKCLDYLIEHQAASWVVMERVAARRQIQDAALREWYDAARRGSRVHGVIEKAIAGEPLTAWDDELRPYVEAFRRFVDDFHPVFGQSELTVFNEAHHYAGTLDAWASLGAMPHLGVCLLDWKTSRAVYPDYALQLAAYSRADYGLDGDTYVDLPKFDRALIVHLAPTGYSVHPMRIDQRAFDIFLAALNIARFTAGEAKWFMEEALAPSQPGHEFDVLYLIQQIKDMEVSDRLTLSVLFVEESIPTKPGDWSEVDAARIQSLIWRVAPPRA